MQNQDKIIISMISDASVFINNALHLDGYRKNIFSNSDLTDGEKQLYKSRNNLCSRLYIEASTNLLKTIYILDGKEYNQDDNLYQLYLNLSNEEQNNLYDGIYQKYNQLFELRSNSRKEKLLENNKINNDIEIKLKKNIDLINDKDLYLDSDFLKKFTLGVNRYFINDCLFSGKLSNIQKQNDIRKIIDSLRSVVDEEDAKFRKFLSNSKLNETDSIIL